MKKRITLALLLLIVFLLLIVIRFVGPETKGPSDEADLDHTISSTDRQPSAGNRAQGTDSQAQPGSEPKSGERLSFQASTATANIVIEEGETLVMGGYRTPEGRHDFTMVTPSIYKAEDGTESVLLKSRVLSIDVDFAHKSGMNSLTTHYPTADQHAEAWSDSKLRETLQLAREHGGMAIMSQPTVFGPFGQSLVLELSSGPVSYVHETAVEKNPGGGFAIQSKVKRTMSK